MILITSSFTLSCFWLLFLDLWSCSIWFYFYFYVQKLSVFLFFGSLSYYTLFPLPSPFFLFSLAGYGFTCYFFTSITALEIVHLVTHLHLPDDLHSHLWALFMTNSIKPMAITMTILTAHIVARLYIYWLRLVSAEDCLLKMSWWMKFAHAIMS